MRLGDADVSRRTFLAGGALTLAGAKRDQGDAARASERVSFTRHAVAEKDGGRLRVVACQILTGPDVGKSTEKVLQWIEKAATDAVDVIAFPVACLCGYAGGDYWNSSRPEDFQQGEARVIEAMRRLNIAVVLGTIHWEGEKIFNDLLVIDKGGIVRGRSSKAHLTESWPTPGRVLPVYEAAGVKSCFVICHDRQQQDHPSRRQRAGRGGLLRGTSGYSDHPSGGCVPRDGAADREGRDDSPPMAGKRSGTCPSARVRWEKRTDEGNQHES